MGKIKYFKALLTRVCAVLCTLALLAAVPFTNVFSDSAMDNIQNEIDKTRKENEERKKKIEGYGNDIANNQEAMKLITEQIDGINAEIVKYGQFIIAKQDSIDAKAAEIEMTEKSISQKEIEIETKKADIAAMQARNKASLKRFAELARVLYMNDVSDTIPILSGSDDWYEYFVYSDVIKNISAQNLEFMNRLLASIREQEEMIDGLNAEIEKLEQDKLDLENQKRSLESDMAELETEKAALERYAAEQKSYLYGLAAQNKSLQEKIDGLEYDIEESNRKLEELDKELQELIRKAQQNSSGEDYSSDFRWPLDPQFHRLTTYFGWDTAFGGRNHGGIDIVGSGVSVSSQNIYAVQSGTVIKVYSGCAHDYGKYYSCGCGGGWGNYVVIDHGGKISTLYAHCRKIYVSEGQKVTKGDVIGIVGTTGWSTGEHLHFEVRVDGNRVDPLNYTYHDVY